MVRFSVGGHPNTLWNVFFVVGLDLRSASARFVEIVGQILVLAPQAAVLQGDESGNTRKVVVGMEERRAWNELVALRSGRERSEIMFLAALAAEG